MIEFHLSSGVKEENAPLGYQHTTPYHHQMLQLYLSQDEMSPL